MESKLDTKLEKYYVTIKLHINPISERFDMYKFRMDFFDSGESEEFILLQQNY